MLTKVLVLTVALFLVVFYAREIRAVFRAQKEVLVESASVGIAWGLVAFILFSMLWRVGDWLVPGIFGRETFTLKVYAACALSAGLAVWAIRMMDAKDARDEKNKVDAKDWIRNLRGQ